MANTLSVLFVCVHDDGRSQMAAGYLNYFSSGFIEGRSAGSAPALMLNRVVVEAMLEEGIDLLDRKPKILTEDAVKASDVVITMGCGDACPFVPGKRYLYWQIDDPAGRALDAVRPIRNEIRWRVENLVIAELQASGRQQSHGR
ncbi:LMWPc-domain-containing protein [Penicillium diatomitis]|uniref:LMWPc-domain-containing protein n=1 Tax=Penicillium diatomitis TaxID=2819901 RepID=A0A9W9WUA4_9EURO|nr:LMWPc-domain-containing protein [Penicillium diatomitis]KAJ5475656.1 LMWPc-domain-containing protein [Penicillium diatomitis]